MEELGNLPEIWKFGTKEGKPRSSLRVNGVKFNKTNKYGVIK